MQGTEMQIQGSISAVSIVVGILVVAALAGALIWWMKKTRGGRRAP